MENFIGWIHYHQEIIYIVILSIFLGIEVIGRVPSVLHTPLMSGANAIHGVVIIGAAGSVTTLFAGALIYGLGTGLFSPATSAWTADLSSIEHRGRGMATMYIALEAGIGIGAFIAGWIFGDNLSAVPFILYGFALMQVVALFYLGFKYKPMFQKRRKLL